MIAMPATAPTTIPMIAAELKPALLLLLLQQYEQTARLSSNLRPCTLRNAVRAYGRSHLLPELAAVVVTVACLAPAGRCTAPESG